MCETYIVTGSINYGFPDWSAEIMCKWMPKLKKHIQCDAHKMWNQENECRLPFKDDRVPINYSAHCTRCSKIDWFQSSGCIECSMQWDIGWISFMNESILMWIQGCCCCWALCAVIFWEKYSCDFNWKWPNGIEHTIRVSFEMVQYTLNCFLKFHQQIFRRMNFQLVYCTVCVCVYISFTHRRRHHHHWFRLRPNENNDPKLRFQRARGANALYNKVHCTLPGSKMAKYTLEKAMLVHTAYKWIGFAVQHKCIRICVYKWLSNSISVPFVENCLTQNATATTKQLHQPLRTHTIK